MVDTSLHVSGAVRVTVMVPPEHAARIDWDRVCGAFLRLPVRDEALVAVQDIAEKAGYCDPFRHFPMPAAEPVPEGSYMTRPKLF